ncbi:MAG: alpha-1,2-fucosyltransferase [Candidatus Sedimenticola endophacoides]
MIIFAIKGGLGNQLFQFAALKALEGKIRDQIVIDLTFFQTKMLDGNDKREFHLNEFDFDYPIMPSFLKPYVFCIKILRKLIPSFAQPVNSINDAVQLANKKNTFPIYLEDYWQTQDTIDLGAAHVVSAIKKTFNARTNQQDTPLSSALAKISASSSIAMQIRRGDYITNKLNLKIFGACNDEYFKQALTLLESDTKTRIYVFSDETDLNPKFIDHVFTISSLRLSTTDEFLLLSTFDKVVISNSTFGWWAAYVESKYKKVIAPFDWFTGLDSDLGRLPTNWKRISKG